MNTLTIPQPTTPVNMANTILSISFRETLEAHRYNLRKTREEMSDIQEMLDDDFERLNSDDIAYYTRKLKDLQQAIPHHLRLIDRYERHLAEVEGR